MINVGMVTLGCPKNTVDSEVMAGFLQKSRIKMVSDLDRADVVVVNTCGFIESAKEESIETILKINELKEFGSLKGLVVAGCLVNKYKNELVNELSEADAFLGTSNLDQVVQAVHLALDKDGKPRDYYFSRHPKTGIDPLYAGRLIQPSHTAYLKISEGCSNTCKFCSIPMMRGKNKSRSLESLIEEAVLLAQKGVKELNIIGQDTTDYGTDLYGEPRLAHLLRELAKIKSLKWIRLFYAFPAHLTQEMIQVLAEEPKICPYLDMPIQHTDDEILLNMNRKLDGKGTLKLIETIRENIPGVALRTTLIVGLPGETDEKFSALLADVNRIRFDRLGVFTYSNEEHVPATKMKGGVSEAVKLERQKAIMEAQKEISRQFNQDKVGETIEVMAEPETGSSRCAGRSVWDGPEIDGRVYLNSGSFQPGEFVKAKVVDYSDYDLIAEPVGQPV